jgi:hypothetical protein
MAVLLVIEGEEVDRSALTVDLSPHGLRLQTAAWLTPGQQVGLLPLPNDSSKDVIGACVVWVGKAETYQAGQAGLAFLRPLPSSIRPADRVVEDVGPVPDLAAWWDW